MGREETWGLGGVAEYFDRSGEISWVVEWIGHRLHRSVRGDGGYLMKYRMSLWGIRGFVVTSSLGMKKGGNGWTSSW